MGKAHERHILYYLNLAKTNGDEFWQATEQEYDQIVHSWNLLTSKQVDFDADWAKVVLEFIRSVRKFQNIRGLWRDQISWCEHGLAVARIYQNVAEEMRLLNSIGSCNEELGNPVLALEKLQASVSVARQHGKPPSAKRRHSK